MEEISLLVCIKNVYLHHRSIIFVYYMSIFPWFCQVSRASILCQWLPRIQWENMSNFDHLTLNFQTSSLQTILTSFISYNLSSTILCVMFVYFLPVPANIWLVERAILMALWSYCGCRWCSCSCSSFWCCCCRCCCCCCCHHPPEHPLQMSSGKHHMAIEPHHEGWRGGRVKTPWYKMIQHQKWPTRWYGWLNFVNSLRWDAHPPLSIPKHHHNVKQKL